MRGVGRVRGPAVAGVAGVNVTYLNLFLLLLWLADGYSAGVGASPLHGTHGHHPAAAADNINLPHSAAPCRQMCAGRSSTPLCRSRCGTAMPRPEGSQSNAKSQPPASTTDSAAAEVRSVKLPQAIHGATPGSMISAGSGALPGAELGEDAPSTSELRRMKRTPSVVLCLGLCEQCITVYGSRNYNGNHCARACVLSNGRSLDPDCENPAFYSVWR